MFFPQFIRKFRSQRIKFLPVLGIALSGATFISCGSGARLIADTPTQAAQSVAIIQPSANSVVASPVHVLVAIGNAAAVRSMLILVDGAQVYVNNGASLDTPIDLSAGSHQIAVQATDSSGKTYQDSISVTATTTSAGEIDPNLIIYDHVEEEPWLTCGNCGNSGGSVGDTATYVYDRAIQLPSLDGSSSKFSIGGPYPYTNAYWYSRHAGPSSPVQYLNYQFDLYIPSGSEQAPQAIEFECQQHLGGYIYNFAWQAEYPGKAWRIFDYVNSRWDDTGIAFTPFTPDTWHQIAAEYHVEGSTVVHDTLTVDGVIYKIGIKHQAKYTGGSISSFTNAFQLDLNKYATPFSVYVDSMKISVK